MYLHLYIHRDFHYENFLLKTEKEGVALESITFTNDPIEAEVSHAAVNYKYLLIMSHGRNFWHRLQLKIGVSSVVELENNLRDAEKRLSDLIVKSEQHTEAYKRILAEMPQDIHKDEGVDAFMPENIK